MRETADETLPALDAKEPLPDAGGSGAGVPIQTAAEASDRRAEPEASWAPMPTPSPDVGPPGGAMISTAATEPPDAQPNAAPGELSAVEPIRRPAREPDRTFLIALGLVLVLHVGVVGASVRFAIDEVAERERRGQVERSEIVTVELVEEPDGESRSRRSQIGDDAPPPPQPRVAEDVPPAPPAEAQEQAEAQPPVAVEPPPQPREPLEKPPDKQPDPRPPKPERTAALPPTPGPKPRESELSIADFDVSMNAYAEAVDRSQAERRRQSATRNSEQQRVKGAAAQGTQSAYSKSVIAALARTKPKSYITRGDVFVRFELLPDGQFRSLRIIQSSRDPLLDQLAIDAIRKAVIPRPPANADPSDLSYVIHYRFE